MRTLIGMAFVAVVVVLAWLGAIATAVSDETAELQQDAATAFGAAVALERVAEAADDLGVFALRNNIRDIRDSFFNIAVGIAARISDDSPSPNYGLIIVVAVGLLGTCGFVGRLRTMIDKPKSEPTRSELADELGRVAAQLRELPNDPEMAEAAERLAALLRDDEPPADNNPHCNDNGKGME